VDANLFNGDYYEQKVIVENEGNDYDPSTNTLQKIDFRSPPLQLANACLVDQLVGVLIGKVSGINGLLDPVHVRRTLETIHKHNFHRSLHNHFNHMRTFALGDEAATVMASYPHGDRPEVPFPYYTEVMTGFEYTAAIHMLYEGMTEQGLELMQAGVHATTAIGAAHLTRLNGAIIMPAP
jgi:non-lysosomal glucosylceramidase